MLLGCFDYDGTGLHIRSPLRSGFAKMGRSESYRPYQGHLADGQIADLTLLTKQMLDKKDVAGSLSVRANLEMRTIGELVD